MSKELNIQQESSNEDNFFSKYPTEKLIQLLKIILKEADEREKHREDLKT